MTVAETLLVYVGAPLAVIVPVALLIYLPGGRSRSRYRPGQPWNHEPVWYEPHPEHAEDGGHDDEPAAIGSSAYPERQRAIGSGHGPEVSRHTGDGPGMPGAGAQGGSAHGASAVGAGAPVLDAGPLGGARGTW